MEIFVENDKSSLGQHAAAIAVTALQEQLDSKGGANLILATGASQFELLAELVESDIDWHKVTCFHLDEYLGVSDTDAASFRRYLKERFCDKINGPKRFHWIDGKASDPSAECARLADIIRQHPIDVACIGIGENGHLAFNDPVADFETTDPYILVDLDEACCQQQVGEGWFPSLAEMPRKAISMSISQILKSTTIVCTVPDQRKAAAVQAAVEGPVTPQLPASILQRHPQVSLMLDTAAASLLNSSPKNV